LHPRSTRPDRLRDTTEGGKKTLFTAQLALGTQAELL
jgi:hypothetical protein